MSADFRFEETMELLAQETEQALGKPIEAAEETVEPLVVLDGATDVIADALGQIGEALDSIQKEKGVSEAKLEKLKEVFENGLLPYFSEFLENLSSLIEEDGEE